MSCDGRSSYDWQGRTHSGIVMLLKWQVSVSVLSTLSPTLPLLALLCKWVVNNKALGHFPFVRNGQLARQFWIKMSLFPNTVPQIQHISVKYLYIGRLDMRNLKTTEFCSRIHRSGLPVLTNWKCFKLKILLKIVEWRTCLFYQQFFWIVWSI